MATGAIAKPKPVLYRVRLKEPSGAERYRDLRAPTLEGAQRMGRSWASSVGLGGRVELQEKREEAWVPMCWLAVAGEERQPWRRMGEVPLEAGDTHEGAAALELRRGLELLAGVRGQSPADDAALLLVREGMQRALGHVLSFTKAEG